MKPGTDELGSCPHGFLLNYASLGWGAAALVVFGGKQSSRSTFQFFRRVKATEQ